MTGGRSWGEYTNLLFKPNSIWNKKLPDDVAIDPISGLVVEALRTHSQPSEHMLLDDAGTMSAFSGQSGINDAAFTMCLHIALDGNYTLQPVYLDRPYTPRPPHGSPPVIEPAWNFIPPTAALREAFSEVPIPNDARPVGPWAGEAGVGANPGDNHMAIYQPFDMTDPVSGKFLPGDRMWEFWKCRNHEVDGASDNIQAIAKDGTVLAYDGDLSLFNHTGWHAVYGGAMEHVTHNSGAFFDNDAWKGSGLGWGATASKVPTWGGVIRQEEALAARDGNELAIRHALRFHLLQGATPGAIARRDGSAQIRWPGYGAGDGACQYTFAPAEGDMFRLPAGYVITETNPFMRALQFAIRDYGMIATDTAGACAFQAECRNTTPNSRVRTTDIWRGPSGNFTGGAVFTTNPSTLAVSKIPWGDMQLIDKAYRPTQPIKQRLIIGTP